MFNDIELLVRNLIYKEMKGWNNNSVAYDGFYCDSQVSFLLVIF